MDSFPTVETFTGSNNPGGIYTWTVKSDDPDGNTLGNPFMPLEDGAEPYGGGFPTTLGE